MFRDGSVATLQPPSDVDGPRDAGSRLLEPIDHIDRVVVRNVIADFRRIVAEGELSDEDAAEVRAIANLLEDTDAAAAERKTPRWKLVAVVRSALSRFVHILGPRARDTYFIGRLIQFISDGGWEATLESLRKLLD